MIFKKLLILYASMLLLFVGAMTCVNSIPFTRIADNIQTSNEIFIQEGLYYSVPDFHFFRLDNFTNLEMLNLAVSVDDKHPFKSVCGSPSFWDGPIDSIVQDVIDCKRAQNCDELEFGNYARYWHGYLVPLRSLLSFTDIRGIRIINYFVIILLFVYCCIKIFKRFPLPVLIFFIISFVLVGLPMVPLSPQLTTCFFITLLACAALLRFPDISRNEHTYICFFFAVGGLTSFMDFLTAPLLTMGIPLILLLYNDKNPWRCLVNACWAWGIGYALLWISKWCLAALFTDIPVFSDAMGAMLFRMSKGGEAVHINNPFLQIILSRPALILFLLFYIGLGVYLYLKNPSGRIRPLLVFYTIAAFPLGWYVILYEHSVHHNFFTWRIIAVSLFAFFIFIHLILRRNTSSNEPPHH